MLIKISSSFNFDSLNDDAVLIIELLASAHRSGNHFVVSDYEVLEFLSNWEKLSAVAKSTYKMLFRKWSQISTVSRFVNQFVELVPFEEPSSEIIDGREVVRYPISRIDYNSLTPTTLMLEDVNDEKTYLMIANWYLMKSGFRIGYRYRLESGGGGRISANFGSFLNKNTSPIICVVDTDKKYPHDSLGNTAEQLLAVNIEGYPLAKVLVLEVHERENLLPFSIFERLHDENGGSNGDVRNSFSAISSFRQHPSAMRYFNIKSGMICGKFFHQFDQAVRDYWEGVIQGFLRPNHTCMGDRCDKILVPGFPARLMRQSIDQYFDKPTEIIVDDSFVGDWMNIGRQIINWCLCDSPRIT